MSGRYFVTEYQPGVQSFSIQTFDTKGAAMAEARALRNANMRRCYRKVQDAYTTGTRIAQFRCEHPHFGVQYAATVHDSALRNAKVLP